MIRLREILYKKREQKNSWGKEQLKLIIDEAIIEYLSKNDIS